VYSADPILKKENRKKRREEKREVESEGLSSRTPRKEKDVEIEKTKSRMFKSEPGKRA